MRLDDLRKLATGSVLFSLDRIISPRLVGVLYLLGLAGILLWAVRHFFAAFFWGFGNGLWGLLEIVVFGLLAFVVLRIACEAVLVYLRAHAREAETAVQAGSASLLDDVRDAIEELAGEEDESDEPVSDTDEPARPRWSAQRAWGPAPGTASGSPASGTGSATPPDADGNGWPEAGEDAPRSPSIEPGRPYS